MEPAGSNASLEASASAAAEAGAARSDFDRAWAGASGGALAAAAVANAIPGVGQIVSAAIVTFVMAAQIGRAIVEWLADLFGSNAPCTERVFDGIGFVKRRCGWKREPHGLELALSKTPIRGTNVSAGRMMWLFRVTVEDGGGAADFWRLLGLLGIRQPPPVIRPPTKADAEQWAKDFRASLGPSAGLVKGEMLRQLTALGSWRRAGYSLPDAYRGAGLPLPRGTDARYKRLQALLDSLETKGGGKALPEPPGVKRPRSYRKPLAIAAIVGVLSFAAFRR